MKNNKIYIPKKFKLKEFIKNTVAIDNNIDNLPSWEIIEKLRFLAERLDLYREELGEPLYIHSGYRSPELNIMLEGTNESFHCTGEAVDLRIGDDGSKINAIILYNSIKKYNKENALQVNKVFLEEKDDVWWVHYELNLTAGGRHMLNYYKNSVIESED